MPPENTVALRILMNDDLYLLKNDFLVENNAEKTLSPTEINTEKEIIVKNREFNFIGKNQKYFLIITNEVLQENHLKALENTLLRKELTLVDVAVLNLSAYQNLKMEELNASFMPQKLVLFGINPQELSLPDFPINKINDYQNMAVLHTYSFTEMLGNKDKTKAFWEPMKLI